MTARGMNIYGRYRRAAGLTQEKAAELLDCPIRTLANWEAGTYAPPDDKVLAMVDVYQSPTLAIEHLRLRSRIAEELLPELEPRSLPEAVCALLAAIRDFTLDESDLELMKIAADGKVSGEETAAFGRVLIRLEDIVDAAYSLRLSRWEG